METAVGLITTNYSVKHPSALTKPRPAAAVPFLGRYRLVDFPLSNMVNSGIETVGVIMPYNYRSVVDHLYTGKDWGLDRKKGGLFLMPGSAFGTSRKGPRFLLRDLIANRVFLDRDKATNVVVSAANIIYSYDYRELIRVHNESGADITLLTKTYSCEAEDVSSVYTEDGHVRGFTYGTRYGDEGFLDCFVVKREKLIELIERYANVDYLDLFEAIEPDLPQLDVRAHRVDMYTGSIFDARMYAKRSHEMLDSNVTAELFPPDRPIMTKAHDNPPAKYESGSRVTNSIVSGGCHIQGTVADSILSRHVVVEPGASVRDCVIMNDCVIKRGARLEHAIIDRGNVITAGIELRGTPEAVLVKEKGGER